MRRFLLVALLVSGCSGAHFHEPINRGWTEGLLELEPVAGELVITTVEHSKRRWCYGFQTERADGEFCASEDLGYEAGDTLRLTLEARP